jgi:type II secretory pathway component GspD/PulD (secretin)
MRFRSSCVGLALVTLGMSVSAVAEYVAANAPLENVDARRTFNIAPGSLESVLMEFSRQTRLQLIVSPRVPNRVVSGLHGSYSAREALQALLGASGLAYTIKGNAVVVYTHE